MALIPTPDPAAGAELGVPLAQLWASQREAEGCLGGLQIRAQSLKTETASRIWDCETRLIRLPLGSGTVATPWFWGLNQTRRAQD